jgi:hypothetical protein
MAKRKGLSYSCWYQQDVHIGNIAGCAGWTGIFGTGCWRQIGSELLYSYDDGEVQP